MRPLLLNQSIVIISHIVGRIAGRGLVTYARMKVDPAFGVRAFMSNEEFVIRGSAHHRAGDDDLEQILEALVAMAQSDGRDFLAYLLRMALMEARNQDPSGTNLSH